VAISELDAKTALVVIDLQRGIVRLPVVHPVESVVANSVRLVQAFRKRNLPVVLVHVGFAEDGSDAVKTRTDAAKNAPPMQFPPDWFEYIDELAVQPSDIKVHKRNWGAFYGTDLDLQLRRRGVTGIVLCGIATSIGVESTARSAWEHNYNIAFAMDAMTDMSQENHDRSLAGIFPRLGEVGSTDEILAELG
jgi:nicotinamidase-related amidase